MALSNESDLLKLLKAEEFANLYYFYGKNIQSIETVSRQLSNKLVGKKNSDMNLHKFNGQKLDLSRLSEASEALPMDSGRICILINDLNAEDFPEKDLEFLMEILSDLPSSTTIIIYNTGIDILGRNKFPTGKNKKIIDCISKNGIICEFSTPKSNELSKRIIASFEKNNCQISKPNAEYLADLCLCNLLLINNEISKLSSYVQQGEITRESIDILVAKQLDSNAFALAKAIIGFDAKKSMQLLDELFAQRLEPIAVMAAISMSFIDLYKARIAVNLGLQVSDVMSDFGIKSNRKFAIENAFKDARKTDVKMLRKCLEILKNADISIKSAGGNGRLQIEKAIVEMLSYRNLQGA